MPALNLPTNLALVEAWAGALYGSAVGQTTMAQVNSDIVSYGGLNNTLNAYYTAGFGSMTTIAIGNLVAANVGLTGAQATTGASIITATLNAAAPSARGTVVLNLLNTFAGLTADATWGVAATAWNTAVNTAITYNGSNATDNSLAIAATTVATQTTAANLAAAQALNKTITLTSGADVLTAGAGNDTFNALYSTAGGMTLQGTDTLDGGAGTDVLNVQIGVTGVTGVASMVNIETVSANFQAAGNLSLLNTTGMTTLETSSGTADSTFSNIPSATVVLKDTNNSNNATFGFAAAAVAGAADVANLTISGVTGGTVTLAGIETVNITSTGAANTIAGLTATAETALKVLGDQGLTITAALGATVATIDASANTAVGGTGGSGVTVIMGAVVATATGTGGSGNDSFNFTSPLGAVILSGGVGNDTFTTTTSLTGDSIDGGAGTDIVATNASIAEQYSTPATRLIVNNETLSLLSQGTSGATLTVANIDTSMVRVNLAGNATGAVAGGTSGAYTIAGPAGTFTVGVGGATGTGASTLGGLLTLTAAGTATTDAASLLNTTVSNNNVFNGQAITSTGYETLTINSGTGASTNSAAQTLGAIIITPSTNGVGALALTGNNPITIGAVTGAKTIDASAMAGAATFTMSAAAGVATTNITGTGGNDTIIAATSTASTVIGGAGNDNITGSTLADTISGGDGNDSITGGVGRDTLTGGAGVDTFVYAANATGSISSNLAAPDTITDFTSGVDKLSITNATSGAPVAFLGNFTTFASGNAAAATDGRAGLAFFVSGENNLYVEATAGTQAVNDTVITLSGVTALAATDLSIGAQGTGATLSLTAASANLSNSLNTNSSGFTTTLDDRISTTAAFLIGSTIDGGAGNDTLVISTDPAGTITLASRLSNVENLSLTLGNTGGTITLPATAGLAVTNASATAAASIVLVTAGSQSVTASGSGALTVAMGDGISNSVTMSGAGALTVTAFGGAASQVINDTGSGVATVTATGLAYNATLGSGSDTFTALTGANTGTVNAGAGSDTFISGVATTITAANVTNFEVLDLSVAGVNTITMTPTQHSQFTSVLSAAGNDVIALSAAATFTGLSTTAGTSVLTYTLTSGTNIFTASTNAMDYAITGTAGAETYNMGATLTAADTITGGTGTDTLNITGAATGAAGDTGIENINVNYATAATFTTGAILTGAIASTINASASTAAVTLDLTGYDPTGGTLVVTDGQANDVITNVSTDAINLLTTINLSSGGADTINYTNTYSAASSSTLTINNFTGGISAGADKLVITTGALQGAAYKVIAANSTWVPTVNSIAVVPSSIVTLSAFDSANGGAAELAILTAITGVTSTAVASTVVIYGSGAQAGKAGIYDVTWTAATVATSSFAVELIAIVGLTGGADSLVSANFI